MKKTLKYKWRRKKKKIQNKSFAPGRLFPYCDSLGWFSSVLFSLVLIYAHKTSFWKSLFVKKMKQHYVLSLYNIVSKKKKCFFFDKYSTNLWIIYIRLHIFFDKHVSFFFSPLSDNMCLHVYVCFRFTHIFFFSRLIMVILVREWF